MSGFPGGFPGYPPFPGFLGMGGGRSGGGYGGNSGGGRRELTGLELGRQGDAISNQFPAGRCNGAFPGMNNADAPRFNGTPQLLGGPRPDGIRLPGGMGSGGMVPRGGGGGGCNCPTFVASRGCQCPDCTGRGGMRDW